MADAQTANELLTTADLPSAAGTSAGAAPAVAQDAVARPNPIDRVFKGIQDLPARNRLALLASIPLFIALVVTMVLWNRPPDYKVLFSGVNDADGGTIIAALNQMGVPHRYDEKHHAITVPAEKVHDTRLKLASQGLPKGSVVGFELMEGQKLGITQFQEHVNYQRALEGELSRSIMTLGAVHSARVHLAIPKPSIFLRDQQKPTASVVLTLLQGRKLDRAQVQGIVHLVASSLPELTPKNVTVVDQEGEILTSETDKQAQNLDVKQMSLVRSFEADYNRRVTEILVPIFGEDNVKVAVTAEFDFSQTDQVSENYKPNLDPTAATVRSQQSLESSERDPVGPAGVPGTLSNQPPSAAAAPIANNPQAGLGGANGSGANNAAQKKESIINYEVDKVVRTTKGQATTLKRVSAGVAVNYRSVTDSDGTKQVPLTAAEVEQIGALVREAIGYNKDRGDTVHVINQPFNKPEEKVLPIWKQAEAVEIARSLGIPMAVALISIALIFGVIRPMLKQPVVVTEVTEADSDDAEADILLPPERQQLETTVGGEADDAKILDQIAEGVTTMVGPNGEPITIGPNGEPVTVGPDGQLIPAAPKEDPLKKKLDELLMITEQYPQLVAVVIKEWMTGE